jgi:tetratricopeptide (TPR) repeat protein
VPAKRGARSNTLKRSAIFFDRSRILAPDNNLPVTIVLFRNMKEFRPYSPNEATAAYYTGDNSRDYIVMSGAAEDDRPIAVHEFMHLLVRRGNLTWPIWLNEGVAELYSTLKPHANTVAVGIIPTGRAISLQLEKWMPLERLLNVARDSPEYNTKQHAGAFYAQSWLLTHMLAISDDYRPGFPKFLRMMTEGRSAEGAFSSVYNKPISAVEKDLKDYFRTSSIKVALFPTQLRKIQVGQPGRADPVLAQLHLARVLASVNLVQEASSRLKQLAAANSDRWEVQDALGQIAWRTGAFAEATGALRKAVALKPPAWHVYYDYARLASSDQGEGAAVLAALREVLRLNPTHLEAKLLAGEQMYRMRQYREAIEHYKTIKSVTPALAGCLFIGMAWAHLGTEQLEDARSAALSADKYAREDRDKQDVARILDYLNRRKDATNLAVSAAAVDDTAPVFRRQAPPARDGVSAFEVKRMPNSVRGTLKQVDCDANGARLTVVSAEKTIHLLISDRPQSPSAISQEVPSILPVARRRRPSRLPLSIWTSPMKKPARSGKSGQ